MKNNLKNIKNTTNEIESDIKFLYNQTTYAQEHNFKLENELEMLKEEISKIDPNINLENINELI